MKITVSLLISSILTFLLLVPFIGIIPYLLTFPLWYIWPELETTGDLVEIGFAWVIIKQPWLWPVFFNYFFIITFLSIHILSALMRDNNNER